MQGPTYTCPVKLSRAVVVYSLLRLAMFAGVFVLVYLPARSFVDSELTAAVTAGFVAAIASMSLSYIVLRKPRESMAAGLAARRGKEPELSDDDAEDDRLGLRKED